MQIGYARVSTKDQNFDLQMDALRKAGCEKVFQEVVSGAKAERPVLDGLLCELRPGDVLVIWKLDRLGRSLRHLVDLAGTLMERDVGLRSLNDPIDTTTPQGRLAFNLFASLAEFERDLIRERTQAGLTAARARGRKGGRPKGLPPQAERTACAAETLYPEQRLSVPRGCRSRGTVARWRPATRRVPRRPCAPAPDDRADRVRSWLEGVRGGTRSPLLMLYSVVDDRSGMAYQEYHGVYGEDVEATLRFLFNAMAPKSVEDCPLQGRPRMIYTDNGPIAKSLVFNSWKASRGRNAPISLGCWPNAPNRRARKILTDEAIVRSWRRDCPRLGSRSSST